MASDREERRKREEDAYYEVWRRGGDPDRMDPDRVYDMAWDHSGEEIAADHMRRAANARIAVEQEQFHEEQFPEEPFPDEEPADGK